MSFLDEKYKSRMTKENHNHFIKTLFISKTKLIIPIINIVLTYSELTLLDLRANRLLLPTQSLYELSSSNRYWTLLSGKTNCYTL